MFSSPTILGCGYFDSRVNFPSVKKTKPRNVNSYELELFCESSGISVLNDTEYPIQKNCILFARPGDVRCSYLHFKTHYIHFAADDPGLSFFLEQIPGFLHTPEGHSFGADFSAICDLFHSPDRFDTLSASARLVSLLRDVLYLEKQSESDESILSRAQRFIHQNYFDDLSVSRIAEHCNISQTHLYRLFKSAGQSSPNEYLLRVKLSNACALLRNTDLPIIEIALLCGFQSQSYFSDCFKRKIGHPPLKYREFHRYKL
ncbi:MAG: helix-turn-helix transcriptional regulator [Clostridia bacterium]|nr:helix-turn-helix transcriptional regulator [Clostridia bacterium]